MMKSFGATAMTGLSGVLPHLVIGNENDTNSVFISALEGECMKAGFAEGDISPEIGMEQPGNYGKSFHKTFHDPCKVRVAVFQDGNKKVALIGIDALGIDKSLVNNVRNEVYKRCGIAPEALMIGASHSHSSGPLGMVQPGEYDHADKFVQSLAYEKSSCADPVYIQMVERKLIETIIAADKSLADTKIGIGRGKEDSVAFNRRFLMKNGITYTHPGQLNPDIVKEAGPVDPEVGVIGTWDKDGKCIGCIVNFACHATTNPGGISANWIYYMEQAIRGAMGPDCVVVFLAGASGDLTQVNNLNPYVNLSGANWARYVGGKVGAEVVKVLLSMPRGTLLPLDAKKTTLAFQRRTPNPLNVKESYETVKMTAEEVGATNWVFAKETVLLDAKLKRKPIRETEVQAIQVGPVVFVSNPAEFFCQLGLDIKSKSPFPFTFPVSLANDCVGYVPTTEAFGPSGGGYETRLTSYSNLEITAGDKMVEEGVNLARQMKPGDIPTFARAPEFKGKPWEYGNLKPQLD